MDFAWLLFFVIPLLGHVLYGLAPDPTGEENCFVRLFNGDEFSPQDEAPRLDRLERVRGVGESRVVGLPVVAHPEHGIYVDTRPLGERPAWVVVETPATFIELPAAKFESYLEHEGLSGPLRTRRQAGVADQPGREIYSKYLKVALPDLDGSLRFLPSPVGLPVEIVPLHAGPYRPGDVIPMRVLCGRARVAGLQIRVSHRALSAEKPGPDFLTTTGDDGEFRFVVHRPGHWRVHTIVMAPARREGAEWESLWAALTFRLD